MILVHLSFQGAEMLLSRLFEFHSFGHNFLIVTPTCRSDDSFHIETHRWSISGWTSGSATTTNLHLFYALMPLQIACEVIVKTASHRASALFGGWVAMSILLFMELVMDEFSSRQNWWFWLNFSLRSTGEGSSAFLQHRRSHKVIWNFD